MSRALNLAVLVSAVAYFVADYFGAHEAMFVAKPLTTILIIVIATRGASENSRYKKAILAGLVFSLIGDVLLLFPEKLFLQGLIAFLFAHFCYIAAFTGRRRFFRVSPLSIWIVVYAVAMVPQLWGFLGVMQVPVAIYMGVILIMVWQAVERWVESRKFNPLLASSGRLAVVGAIFFITSDTTLAFAKFRGVFFGSRLIIMATYFLAQWCIATSVHTSTSGSERRA